MEILEAGSDRARLRAEQTMHEVHAAMQMSLDYGKLGERLRKIVTPRSRKRAEVAGRVCADSFLAEAGDEKSEDAAAQRPKMQEDDAEDRLSVFCDGGPGL